MLSSFLTAFGAVVPFFIYLGIGYILVRSRQADVAFMNRLNRISFRVLFPFMMFNNIYKASADELPSFKLIASALTALIVLVAVLLLIVPRVIPENSRRGVIIQALYRTNYLIYGLPLVLNIYGDSYAGTAGIMVMIVVTFYNISSVIILEMFNGERKTGFFAMLVSLAKNPLLEGCVVGLIFFVTGLRIPSFLESPVSALGNMATPLSLITLGGTLRFDAMRKNRRLLAPLLAIKMLLIPAAALILGYGALGFRGVDLFIFFAIFATPVATASYPMALNMGGDGELAGQLVFLSTTVSLATLFCFIFFMAEMGMLCT